MRRFLAALLYLCLGLPLALSAMLLIATRPWALDRETYKRFVQDDRLYAALQAPEIAARASRTIRLGPAEFDGPALIAAAQKEMPIPEIKAVATKAIDLAMDRIATGGSETSMSIDLRPLKAALKAKSPAMARDYVAALVAPSTDQPGLTQPGTVSKALSAGIDSLVPDSATARPTAGRMDAGIRLGTASRGLSQALLNRMTAGMAAISALLLAGLGALGGAGLTSKLSRAGRFLFVPSIVVLGIGVVMAIPGGLILQNVLPHGLQGMLGGAAGAQLRAYLASALGPIARSFLITGLVGASLGGVLASSRRFSEPKELE